MNDAPTGTLPTGTVTFLYTDIEGSTKRWEQHPATMKAAVERHDALLHETISASGGYVFRTMGDAFCASFPTAGQALSAAISAQLALFAQPWSEDIAPLRVRMALHTGIGEVRDGDYVGTPLNRIARLLAIGSGGQVLLSRTTYDLVCEALPSGVVLRDMGEHRLRDLQQPEHVYQVVIPALPDSYPPLKSLDYRPNNLPTQSTLFIGREKEVGAISQMVLQPDIRLVTLTGPGGTGKTRLSLQAATALIDSFADGVFFVPLAPVTDPSLVADTVTQALGIGEAEGGGEILGNLKRYLRDRQMLLILDNFEQIVKAAPLVREMLSASPLLKVLVTSREVLHLYGEKEYAVPPLAVPPVPGTAGAQGADARQRLSVEQLMQYESVRLFIERARLVKSDFELTNENASAVAEICYRLDGLPLALELAAARVKLLPPQAMLPRLQSRLKLLTGGARDLPTHQQTLRSTIEWSYDLLSPEEQALFRRMAVFVGGCTLEAAEAVCNYDEHNRDGDAIDVLEGISSLLDKSLLRQVDTEGEARFYMLETLREYGLEQMEQAGELEEVRRAHVEFYLPSSVDWLGLTEGGLRVSAWQPYKDRLGHELDNARAASNWLIEHNTEEVVAICTFLSWFWHNGGYPSEARNLLEKALALPGASSKPGYVEALIRSGSLAQVHGDMALGAARFESAIALAKKKRLETQSTSTDHTESGSAGDTYSWGFGWAVGRLAASVASQGGPPSALDLVLEGVEELRAAGSEIALGLALEGLGAAYAFRAEFDKARSILEEAEAIGRRHDERMLISSATQFLGDVLRIQGDFKGAAALYEESLSLSRALGVEVENASILHSMAYTELGKGNAGRARELLLESVAAQHEVENKGAVAETLAGFGALAAYQGQGERAMRLYGAATGMWESNQLVVWPAERAEYERYIAQARGQVDAATGNKAWEEGYAMGARSLEQALDYALRGNS
jgi:predicted ATPase/class 3 adenylate cyclase